MKYVIGIDLGTTNSALAYTEIKPDADRFDAPEVRLMDDSAAGESRRGARRAAAAVVPLHSRRDGFSRRLARAALESGVPSSSPAGSRRSAASKTQAAWWRLRNRGSRTPVSTAPRPSFPGTRRKACERSRQWMPPRNISNICATPGTRKCPTRRSPNRKFWSPFPPRSMPWRAS